MSTFKHLKAGSLNRVKGFHIAVTCKRSCLHAYAISLTNYISYLPKCTDTGRHKQTHTHTHACNLLCKLISVLGGREKLLIMKLMGTRLSSASLSFNGLCVNVCVCKCVHEKVKKLIYIRNCIKPTVGGQKSCLFYHHQLYVARICLFVIGNWRLWGLKEGPQNTQDNQAGILRQL